MAVTVELPAGDTTIRLFTVDIPEAELEDLRACVSATRFPDKGTVEDDSQGVPLALMQELARYSSRSSRSVSSGRATSPRDDILDNITLFWLTNTGVSSARLYWEFKGAFFAVKGVKVPVGVSTIADETYRAPRSIAALAMTPFERVRMPSFAGATVLRGRVVLSFTLGYR